ncbi:MAG: squalene cyclase [Acidimicrobiia bacterium]
MANSAVVIGWLIDSDPSIRWQVMRDLLDAPESEWTAERAKVETEGWGARLLSHEDEDGQWAGGAFVPSDFDFSEWQKLGQPWTATTFSLSQLREFGLDPFSDRAQRAVELIGANSRWDEGGQPYWEGEVEECINGRTVADGAYFGVDVSSIVDRLVGERLNDGGWNCERVNGSVSSSFASTINVLEGLLEYERATGGTPESQEARKAGEEYLLKRSLFRRLSTGEPADERFLQFIHPNRWRYDVLRGLDYFRSSATLTGTAPDPRLDEAIGHVRSRRLEDGTWPLDWSPPGRVWFDVDDGEDRPSRWVTLRAMRVLIWWEGYAGAAVALMNRFEGSARQ